MEGADDLYSYTRKYKCYAEQFTRHHAVSLMNNNLAPHIKMWLQNHCKVESKSIRLTWGNSGLTYTKKILAQGQLTNVLITS